MKPKAPLNHDDYWDAMDAVPAAWRADPAVRRALDIVYNATITNRYRPELAGTKIGTEIELAGRLNLLALAMLRDAQGHTRHRRTWRARAVHALTLQRSYRKAHQ